MLLKDMLIKDNKKIKIAKNDIKWRYVYVSGAKGYRCNY